MNVVVKLAGPIQESRSLGPYENCGDADDIREHVWFDVSLTINGKPVIGVLELQARRNAAGEFKSGYEKGWTASMDCFAAELRGQSGLHECLECGGNRGRSTPETSGDTAIAVGKLIQSEMKALGYEIAYKHASIGIFHIFQMLCRAGKGRDKAKGRLIGQRVEINCPVHGKHDQDELELECD
jgi:hypothetical protein